MEEMARIIQIENIMNIRGPEPIQKYLFGKKKIEFQRIIKYFDFNIFLNSNFVVTIA